MRINNDFETEFIGMTKASAMQTIKALVYLNCRNGSASLRKIAMGSPLLLLKVDATNKKIVVKTNPFGNEMEVNNYNTFTSLDYYREMEIKDVIERLNVKINQTMNLINEAKNHIDWLTNHKHKSQNEKNEMVRHNNKMIKLNETIIKEIQKLKGEISQTTLDFK